LQAGTRLAIMVKNRRKCSSKQGFQVMASAQPGSVFCDRDLALRVSSFLTRYHFSSLRFVEVEASQGLIVLSGIVPSFRFRQLCIELVKRVDGVAGIDDRLVVVTSDERHLAVHQSHRSNADQTAVVGSPLLTECSKNFGGHVSPSNLAAALLPLS
jgi:osmotically-inducible protein OsmY